MRRAFLLIGFLSALYGSLHPLTGMRGGRPPEERLGFYPPPPIIKALSADHYQFLSQVIFLDCVFYYGTLVEREETPNWERMVEALYTSTRLDPYNMDTYYLAQAVLPWEAGLVKPTIQLLEYGFRHRDWDWYLPLFLSFDYAYFLRDYERAGHYMTKTAELNPGVAYFSTLAARYFYEAGRTALALAYLRELIPQERNEQIKKQMVMRAEALEGILILEEAVAAFKERYHRIPEDLKEVQRAGLLEKVPTDPYGGEFFLDGEGRVRTTSKLAYRRK